MARRILERLDFEVVEAPDTDAGYDACQRQPPDFIFLDLHIPGGVEFLGYQRSRVGGLQPKVLLCTVESDDPHLDNAFRAGADDYMLKPFDRQVLETRLREIGVLEPLAEATAMAAASA